MVIRLRLIWRGMWVDKIIMRIKLEPSALLWEAFFVCRMFVRDSREIWVNVNLVILIWKDGVGGEIGLMTGFDRLEDWVWLDFCGFGLML